MQIIYVIIAIASSLPVLLLSGRRVVKERSLFAVGMAVVCAFLAATYVSAVLHVAEFAALASWLGIRLCADALGIVICLTVVALNAIALLPVWKMTARNCWIWLVALMVVFLIVCLLIGIAGSIMTGVPVEQCFFDTCCGMMGAVGVAWGLTYKEICVIGNIYIEAVLCLLSALWVVWVCVSGFLKRRNAVRLLLMLFGVGYGLLALVAFVAVCVHYAMPLEQTFDLCYCELVWLAREFRTTYNIVNYIIFILAFLVVVVGNMVLAKVLEISYESKECSRAYL